MGAKLEILDTREKLTKYLGAVTPTYGCADAIKECRSNLATIRDIDRTQVIDDDERLDLRILTVVVDQMASQFLDKAEKELVEVQGMKDRAIAEIRRLEEQIRSYNDRINDITDTIEMVR